MIYQVYPRSFADSNGDGVGDLPGLIARLDHIAGLGADAVWLSPIFRSPMHDFGYDVADHRDVDPIFGSLADADRLIAGAHARGLRVILDLVPNHTSSLHPWFLDARTARTAVHRDWYVWRDPALDGGPPNDLVGHFGGSAWTFDEGTGQYWYHSFLPQQPDLDWRNPEVRAAMLDTVRFWFDRGVDGFRIDVVWMIAKDRAPWVDGRIPATASGLGGDPRDALEHGDGPGIDRYLRELRAVAEAYPGRALVGELYMGPERAARYYGLAGDGLHLPLNTTLITTPWTVRDLRRTIEACEAAMPPTGWPTWVVGNHDQRRVASRLGQAQARVAAMLLLTLRGTPFLYNGDELGLPDVAVPPERVVDVDGRDPQRSPMPWTTGPGAGFSNGEPWLPMVRDPGSWSVATQEDDPRSMLTLHRLLLELRRSEPALHVGSWAPVEAPADVLAYDREHAGSRFRILLNLGKRPADVVLGDDWAVALSTGLDRDPGEPVGNTVRLRGDEGVLLARLQRERLTQRERCR